MLNYFRVLRYAAGGELPAHVDLAKKSLRGGGGVSTDGVRPALVARTASAPRRLGVSTCVKCGAPARFHI